jgi:hypothetical protein
MNDQEATQFIESLAHPDLEITALLAAKYRVDQRDVHEILRTYSLKHDPVNKFLIEAVKGNTDSSSRIEPDTTYASTIAELSKLYNLPTDRIAAMLIDFKIWTACGEHQSASN